MCESMTRQEVLLGLFIAIPNGDIGTVSDLELAWVHTRAHFIYLSLQRGGCCQ